MKDKTLYLVRGLTGSGKSTLANALECGYLHEGKQAVTVSTDDYWTRPDGEYRFDPTKLKEAHAYIQDTVWQYIKGLNGRYDAVIVHNTFSCNWEMETYKKIAKDYGWFVFVIECQNNFGSTHDVPNEVRERMAERWESNNE